MASNKQSNSKANKQQGASLLVTVLIASSIISMVLLALQIVTTTMHKRLQSLVNSKKAFYVTESAMNDMLRVIKIKEENGEVWPDGSHDVNNKLLITDPIGEAYVYRTLYYDENGKLIIDIISDYHKSQRRLVAEYKKQSETNADNLDIMLVIDVSGSMDDNCNGNHPYDTESGGASPPCLTNSGENDDCSIKGAKEAAIAFINDMQADSKPDDRIGVISYNYQAQLVSPLTNLDNVDTVIQDIKEMCVAGYTNIGDGIQKAHDEIMNNFRDNSKKIIILMSDGIANKYRSDNGNVKDCQTTPVIHTTCTKYVWCELGRTGCDSDQTAALAKNDDIELYTIGLGLLALSDTYCNSDCKQVATETLQWAATDDDHYRYAPDATYLTDIYKQIAQEIKEGIYYKIHEEEP